MKIKFNTKLIKIFLCIPFILIYFSCSDQNEKLIAEDKKLSLANNFYNNELYEAAIKEYNEYVTFYDVDDNRKANSLFTIAEIYFERLHDYEKALEYYFRVKYLYPQSNLQSEVGKKIVNCLERLERSQDAQRVLNKETALFEEDATEPKPGAVLCTIGDKKITQGDLDFDISELPPYLQDQFNSKGKKIEFLKQKVLQELLFDSAKRKGLDKDKDILEATYRAKKGFMAQKLLNEEIQNMIDISEEDVELYFKANQDKYAEKDKDGKIIKKKSFQEAAQLAANDLIREKQEKAQAKLFDRLMKAQNVKIFEDRIK